MITEQQLKLSFLRQRQSLPLESKIRLSEIRIKRWLEHWNGDVYVSFSGGKDSTVLLDIVRSVYPRVVGVFADTGLEYPEIRSFVKTISNIEWIRPEISFKQVLEKYGYPIISKKQAQYIHECQRTKSFHLLKLRTTGIRKNGTHSPMSAISKKWQYLIKAPFKISHKCCDSLKKRPMEKYSKNTGYKAIVGTMASEGGAREKAYLRSGCNSFEGKVLSRPLSFWTDKDIWDYIKLKNLPYSKIYDMGYVRTGCMFCAFGCHLEKYPNRFQHMAETHPKQHHFCMYTLGMKEVLEYINVPTGLEKYQPYLLAH